ncbi:hypothetical protein PAHAL_8G002900 [Panicum hallii]|uniref:Uncharacterized protein n=1 Tax=Panicum hallii TaxID=206008 RepID=A0A2T8I6Z0_9POAL|nr:hypothetical protein PAHAL_8G002900 [Panicum hallii]
MDGCHASQVRSRLPRPLPLNYACRQSCFHRQTTTQSLRLTFKVKFDPSLRAHPHGPPLHISLLLVVMF